MDHHQGDEIEGRNPYILRRDYQASIRLNHNHWLLKEINGGHLLHPQIPLPKTRDKPLQIADVATGTGIWAAELAAQLTPELAQVTAFDISSDQYPPPASRPSNLDLVKHDCFKPFAQEHFGRYDIVHGRFMLCLINNPDAEPLFRNVATLLKPGGYLNWFEPIPPLEKVVKQDPSVSSPSVDALKKLWAKPQENSSYDWVTGMPEILESLNPQPLEIVAVDKIPVPTHYLLAWQQTSWMAMDELVANNRTLSQEKRDGIRRMVAGLQEEASRGIFLQSTFQNLVARMPEL